MKSQTMFASALFALGRETNIIVDAFSVRPFDALKMNPSVESQFQACSFSVRTSADPMRSYGITTSLHMSDSSEDLEVIRRKDPLLFLVKEIEAMDINAIINTGLILIVAIAVLAKVATVNSGITRGWTVAEMASRIPVDNWNSYSAVLQDAPLYTKAVTSATVYTIGDLIAQRTEGADAGSIDRGRTLRSLIAGLIGHGPLSHIWYDWSEGIFNDVLHWTEWWSFIPKVVVDQTTWGPFWNNVYIILLGVMKFENPAVIWDDIKRTTIPLVVSGLKLWPLAHCITYGLVPVENRLLWVDLVEIIWVTILATQAAGSSVAHSTSEPNATSGK